MQIDFNGLKAEKRQGILNAALGEFADKGYALASTNGIVRRAGISKGALFTYFPTKKELFLYLCDYGWEILRREYLEAIPAAGGDLIARLHEAVLLKMAVLERQPRLIAFLARLLVEDDPEVAAQAAAFSAKAMELQNRVLYSGLDERFFREDLPPEQAQRMICWCVNGYAAQLTPQAQKQPVDSFDMEGATRDFENFLALLRKVYYR